MRYSAVEKEETIRLVEQSSLSVQQTLVRLNIRKSTFYIWLELVQTDGVAALEDHKPSLVKVFTKGHDKESSILTNASMYVRAIK